MSTEMQLIMENWRVYKGYAKMTLSEAKEQAKEEHREERLRDTAYITEVLGVELPLNESYPYSSELSEKILQEQLFLENWWDVISEGSLFDWAKQKYAAGKEKVVGWMDNAVDWFGDKVEDVKKYPQTIKMLFIAVTNPQKINLFAKAINRKGLAFVKKIKDFLNWVIKKNAFGFETLKKWAEAGLAGVEKMVSFAAGIDKPWLKAIGLTAMAIGIGFLWSKVVKFAEDLIGCGGEEEDPPEGEEGYEAPGVEDVNIKSLATGKGIDCAKKLITKYLKDKAASMFSGVAEKLATTAADVLSGGVGTFWNWAQKIAGGVGFVVGILDPVLSFFKARGGFCDSGDDAEACAKKSGKTPPPSGGAGYRESPKTLGESETEMIGRIVREEYALVMNRRTG